MLELHKGSPQIVLAIFYLEVHGYVVISGVISPSIWAMTTVTLIMSPLITTHEPPSKPQC